MDTASDINVIKLDALDEDLLVDENEAMEITGIAQSRISTIGTINVEYMKSEVTFHVVHSEFPINTDGVLGRAYLRQEKVEISFWQNTIVTTMYFSVNIPRFEMLGCITYALEFMYLCLIILSFEMLRYATHALRKNH